MSVHKAVLVMVLLLGMAAWTGTAAAQSASPVSPQTAAAGQTEARSQLPKTLIFVSIAAVADVAVGTFITGGLVTGTEIALLNSASGWLLYHLHETAWAASSRDAPLTGMVEVVKTTTFTAANGVRLFSLGFLFTQNLVLSAEFLVLNAIGDAASYIATDQIWAYVTSTREPTATARP